MPDSSTITTSELFANGITAWKPEMEMMEVIAVQHEPSSPESITTARSAFRISAKNGKRRMDDASRKTTEEKQMELRCTEFAAGRQTTAKCLTSSTKNLHRLKSVS